MATAAKKSMRLLILGATGGIGLELVGQAIERGHQVTALVRAPQKLGGLRERVRVIQGDVLNPQQLQIALAGQDAVLSSIGPPGLGRSTITSDVAQATVKAMKSTGTHRIVIVGVGMLFADSGLLGRALRNTLMRNIAKDSAKMESVITTSGLDWTIVRPPRLTNGPRRERYGIADSHLPPGAGGAATISRADVAHFLLDEVESCGHLQRIVGIAYT